MDERGKRQNRVEAPPRDEFFGEPRKVLLAAVLAGLPSTPPRRRTRDTDAD